MSVLFVIPAKAHSSRVVGKNTRLLGGLPLFCWTVQAAVEAKGPDDFVVVSTDEGPDGDEIARLAMQYGASVTRRPPELCRDPAQAPDVAIHALDVFTKPWDSVCMLLPTSPFRSAQHIREALALHQTDQHEYDRRQDHRNVVSVSDGAPLDHKLVCGTNRTLILTDPPLHGYEAVFGEWMTKPVPFLLNGAIWITTPARLRTDKHISAIGAMPYVMDRESGLDIDDELDFDLAEAIVRRRYESTTPRCVA